jgi:hypothetical protein
MSLSLGILTYKIGKINGASSAKVLSEEVASDVGFLHCFHGCKEFLFETGLPIWIQLLDL